MPIIGLSTGAVASSYAGTYAAGTAYTPGQIVTFSGGSYVALQSTTGTAPTAGTSTSTWALLAAQGSAGTPGTTGSTGNTGSPGAAATVAVGSTSTGAAGSSASVSNSGSSSAAVLNFTIPQGAAGPTGNTGSTGSAGTAATVTVGSTSTGSPGSSASVSNSGSSSAAVLNFTIPQGATGNTGSAGPGVAAGGSYGNVLVKNSTTNYDTSWAVQTGVLYSAAGSTTVSVSSGATSATGAANFNLAFSGTPIVVVCASNTPGGGTNAGSWKSIGATSTGFTIRGDFPSATTAAVTVGISWIAMLPGGAA